MNKLSLFFVTLVMGGFVTFGDAMWPSKSGGTDSSIIDRINQSANKEALESGLQDLAASLEKESKITVQEIKANNVLSRLGKLLEDEHSGDQACRIKKAIAEILLFICDRHCDYVFESNIHELLIKQLGKNSTDDKTKDRILFVLALIAKLGAEARDTLIRQGLIETISILVDNQSVLYGIALFVQFTLSIEGLDARMAHSLVPVLVKLLKLQQVEDVFNLALEAAEKLVGQRSMSEFYDEELVTLLMRVPDDHKLSGQAANIIVKLVKHFPGGGNKFIKRRLLPLLKISP